ncbi:FHA domain-containing protein [Flavobacteriaceae bacterium]|nr:FHA domain-containing protein [Flavobacteriaceae bacterium]
MKYIYLFCLLFLLNSNSLFSQLRIIDNADITNFPEIEFSINNRNPNLLTSSSFKFSELINGKTISSDSVSIYRIKDSIEYSKTNKCVLILLESLVHKQRKEQNLTFKSSILEILDKVVNKGDKFKIVTFSLKDRRTNILHDVNETFTDSISLLKKNLENHKTQTNDFTNKTVSDIYEAIIQGISELEDFNTELPKSILLLSEESNNKRIGNLSSNAITLANQKGVVINTIKYNRSNYYQKTVSILAKSTYGISKVLNDDGKGDLKIVNEEKKIESNTYIESILDNVVERSLGVDYNIVLKLNDTIKDGKNHIVQIKINNNNQVLKLNYKSPGNWVIAQFQINFLRAVIVSLILIIILGFLIYFIYKKYKINLQNKLNVIKQQKQKEEEQEASILAQKEELLKIKNQQEKIKIEEAEDLRRLNEKALIKQMLSAGSFPILKFSDSKTSLQFEINNPIIKIGRDKDSNNICIANKNISRNHFSIIFNNHQYKVKDNNSTNGIKLNGRKIKESLIKHADIIEIAEMSFTFYE